MHVSRNCVLLTVIGCVTFCASYAVAESENTPRRWSYQGTAFLHVIQLVDGEVKVSNEKIDRDDTKLETTRVAPELESPEKGELPAKLSIAHVTACKWKERGVIAAFNYRHEGRSGSFWYSDSGKGGQHFGLIVHPEPKRHYRCLDVRPVGDSDLVEFIFNEYKNPSQTRPERMLLYYNSCVGATQSIGDPGRWHLLTLGKEVAIPDSRRFPQQSVDEDEQVEN